MLFHAFMFGFVVIQGEAIDRTCWRVLLSSAMSYFLIGIDLTAFFRYSLEYIAIPGAYMGTLLYSFGDPEGFRCRTGAANCVAGSQLDESTYGVPMYLLYVHHSCSVLCLHLHTA